MFEVFYDDDMELFSVQAQYECGEWGFFGSFRNQADAYRRAAILNGEAGLDCAAHGERA